MRNTTKTLLGAAFLAIILPLAYAGLALEHAMRVVKRLRRGH
ncbi:MAG: hypothetical protein ABIE42_05810 [Candidatus Eisenbacteria bacterium]